MNRYLLITACYFVPLTVVLAVNVLTFHQSDPLLGDPENAFVIYWVLWATIHSPAWFSLLFVISRLPKGMNPLLAGLLYLLIASWLGIAFEVGRLRDNMVWSIAAQAIVVAVSFLAVEAARRHSAAA